MFLSKTRFVVTNRQATIRAALESCGRSSSSGGRSTCLSRTQYSPSSTVRSLMVKSELQQQKQHASPVAATATPTTTTQKSSLKNTLYRSEHPLNSSRTHSFSSWTGRGHDLFSDSFVMGDRPKVLLEAIGPSGFDVSNLIKKIDPNEVAPHGALHMMGSILAFPNACFLWKHIEKTSDITIESLAPIILHRPKIEFLFLGTSKSIPQAQLMSLKKELKEQGNIVVEWLPLSEAMATFNILNGEDRMVATALVLDKDESHYVKDNLDD